MNVGYERVSTFEQDLDLQLDELEKEGCDHIFWFRLCLCPYCTSLYARLNHLFSLYQINIHRCNNRHLLSFFKIMQLYPLCQIINWLVLRNDQVFLIFPSIELNFICP